MSLLSSIADALSAVFGRRRTAAPSLGGGKSAWSEPPSASAAGLLALYMATPSLRAPVSKIAESVAEVPFRLEDRGQPVDTHPFLDLLDRPNPHMSGTQYRAWRRVWLDLPGESFSLLLQEGGLELIPVPATWVTREDGRFRINMGDREYIFEADQVVWDKVIDPLDPFGRGRGPGFAVADEALTSELVAKFCKAYFHNSARPDVVIYAEGMAPGQKDDFETYWLDRFQGASRAWRPAIIAPPSGNTFSIEQLQSTFEEMALIDFRRSVHDIIRQTYGVPPEMIGQLEQSNKATITAAETIMARHVVLPRLREDREAFQKLFNRLHPEDGLSVVFDDPTPQDLETKLEFIQAAPWAFTRNEIRALCDMPTRSDGEVYAVPSTMAIVDAGEVEDMTDAARMIEEPPAIAPGTKLRLLKTDEAA